MLYARVPCTLARPTANNLYGQRGYAAPGAALCQVVKLNAGAAKTSVRTDSSASRGSAEEFVADAVLLFPALYDVAVGTLVTIKGLTLEIKTIERRFTVAGDLDHYEAALVVAKGV